MTYSEPVGEGWDVLASEGPALKEWAAICLALARGEQAVLLRKGGIHERGFDVREPCFYLFPSQFHQDPAKFRPAHAALGEEAMAAAGSEDQVTLAAACEVVDHVTTTAREHLAPLAALTVMTEEALALRYDWKPDQGLHVLVVRARPLVEPVTIEKKPAFGGCRSWVKVGPVEGAIPGPPVLTEPVLDEIRNRVHEIVDAPRA